jgi:hypothetical protein
MLVCIRYDIIARKGAVPWNNKKKFGNLFLAFPDMRLVILDDFVLLRTTKVVSIETLYE